MMDDNTKLIESLLEKAADYGITSIELIKLKTVDKTSDVVSSIIPSSIVFIFFTSFMLFLNLGLAFWMGDIFGKPFWGFFVVAAFYCSAGIVFYFFMHKWLKNIVYNFIIKQVLK